MDDNNPQPDDIVQPRLPLSETMRKFLDERIADMKANPNDRLPWEEVKAAALARYKKKAEAPQ